MASSWPEKGHPAMRPPIDSDTLLDVTLSAICARNQYTHDAAPVIAELTAAARGRDDILAQAAGIWSGYFDSRETRTLASALRSIPGAELWVAEGQRRRGIPKHGAPTR